MEDYTVVKHGKGERLDALRDRIRVFAATDQTESALTAVAASDDA